MSETKDTKNTDSCGRSKQSRTNDNDNVNYGLELMSGRERKRVKPSESLAYLPTKDEAEEALARMFAEFPDFRLGHRAPAGFRVQDALFLFNCHPALACEEFVDGDNYMRDVLSLFIQAEADLTTVRTVYDLVPSYFRSRVYESNFIAIHDACRHGAKEGVLEFLIEHFPKSVVEELRCYRGVCPILMVLGDNNVRPSQLEKTRLLSLMFAAAQATMDELMLIFARALKGHYGNIIMHLLFNQYARYLRESKGRQSFELSSRNTKIGWEEARALSAIIPTVARLKVRPETWTLKGLGCFLQSLRKSCIADLSLDLPSKLFRRKKVLLFLLGEVISGNQHLKKLRLDLDDVDDGYDDALFTALVTAIVASRGNIQELEIRYLDLSQPSLMNDFLSSCPIPSVNFDRFSVEEGWSHCSFSPSCGLKELRIDTSCDLGSECFQGLLSQLGEIPLLQKLALHQHHRTVDLTGPLMSLLRQGRLCHLDICGVDLDCDACDEILKTNQSLVHLAVETSDPAVVACCGAALENANGTLLNVQLLFESEGGVPDDIQARLERIAYLTKINSFGRARARNHLISLEDFVELLGNAATASENRRKVDYGDHWDILSVNNIHYELLRLAPHLWSAS